MTSQWPFDLQSELEMLKLRLPVWCNHCCSLNHCETGTTTTNKPVDKNSQFVHFTDVYSQISKARGIFCLWEEKIRLKEQTKQLNMSLLCQCLCVFWTVDSICYVSWNVVFCHCRGQACYCSHSDVCYCKKKEEERYFTLILLLSFNFMFYLTYKTQQVCNSKAYKCGDKCHNVRTQ